MQTKLWSSISLFIFTTFFLVPVSGFAQKPPINVTGANTGGGVITTGAPFLLISPDARSGGLGDIGAASAPDAFSQHWNPAKYAFLEEDLSISLTYSPWLRNLVDDMNLGYLTASKKIGKRNTLAFSLLYFSLGEVLFVEHPEDPPQGYNPNEFSIDFSYARMLTNDFSIAVAARYIYSNLTMGRWVGGVSTQPGQSVAADIALFYTKSLNIGKELKGGKISAGLNISNIGSKISYSTDDLEKDFIPANLRLGVGFTMDIDDFNSISFLGDINKLLVPTSPIYDTTGAIKAGMNTNVGTMTGIIHSFYDAPGGFKEEMQEIMWSLGAEYWYNKLLAFRLGYFHESIHKGARQYFTLGAGIRYNIFALDVSYLIPAVSAKNINGNNNPLKNTLRFSLTFNFANLKKMGKTPKENEFN
ncbi:MAG: type IX secretion system outer membrane channel protein PorV [Bacteroidales bacterium]